MPSSSRESNPELQPVEKINPYNAGSQPVTASQTQAASPPMTAEFMLELDDLVALSLQMPATRRQCRIGLICLCVLCVSCAVAVVAVWLPGEIRLNYWPLVLLVLVVALSASLSPPILRRRIRRACVKVYGDTLPWQETVGLSAQGIKAVTPDSEGLLRWKAIQRINVTSTHAFFFINNAHACIVPARAFLDEAEFQAFVAVANDFWTGATGRTAENARRPGTI